MKPATPIPRYLQGILPSSNARAQLVLITGARQTGKTTLSQLQYPQLNYLNLDAEENRHFINHISTFNFATTLGQSILDEAQKAPAIFEKMKYAFDAKQLNFSVLLGSSQILLLKQIRESLAGRILMYELFPLMMGELSQENLSVLLIDRLFQSNNIDEVLSQETAVLLPEISAKKKAAQAHLLGWGGMPALLPFNVEERKKWIKDYEHTYLERDLADLSRLHDLEPFRLFQKLTALRSAQLLNYSSLARDAGISVDTARRYLEYLKLSYQTELLQPYYRNLTTSIIKTPKVYWLDVGIYRSLTQNYAENTGEIYETMVVAEMIKWKRTLQRDVELYFYRTQGGLELDLILEMPQGLMGFEIKSRTQIFAQDTRALRALGEQASDRWLGGMVIYNGDSIQQIAPHLWAIPAWRLFTA